MALERYRQKRNFKVTPEPAGNVGKRRSKGLCFVVQKHAATRLHYDFRLELNGVMLSWAVPKGPSLDPNDKRLAMHTEDHPMDYNDFEGVIPAKQYGAGTVMVWDRGTWEPTTDPDEGYAKGRLKFQLFGEKLHGGWNLIKSRSGKYGGDSWLLIKESDDFARLGGEASIVDDRPDSIVTGRSLDEIKRNADRVWHSNRSVADNVNEGAVAKRRSKAATKLESIEGARAAPFPDLMEAQLATLAKTPPSGATWVHEIKYDGYRMLCRIEDGKASLISRSGKDWTLAFASVVRALARLPVGNAWLDGEVVALDDKGRSSFQSLQNALDGQSANALNYFAFDLLYLDGYDLRGASLIARKRALEALLETAPDNVRYSAHFAVNGSDFLENVRKLGLEGMVSKRADRRYQPGRGPSWVKVKCLRRQEMVIGGYTDPEGTREAFGALLIGVYQPDGRLAYSGKVGTGFSMATLKDLHRRLVAIAQPKPAFHNPPTGAEGRRAHWVKPVMVAEVAFTEWTNDGTLRHPTFVGLREDKPARDVVREREGVSDNEPPTHAIKAAPAKPAARAVDDKNSVSGITISNPDKLLYPEAKLSKRDLASYYAAIGDVMLPHFVGRPLSLVRCPNGWDKQCFYQKNVDDSVNDVIARVAIANSDGGTSTYMMAESVPALVALLQMGVLELHPWGSRTPSLGLADRIVFDLDPDEGLAWKVLKDAVAVVRTLLDNLGLPAFLKTTGGKGLHIVTPIEPTFDWETVKGFTKAVAELLERTFPDRFTSKLLKVSRGGRVFIDYLRNAEGATAVGPYSLRARAEAPVATPIEWDELKNDVRFAYFNAKNLSKRMAKLKADPWASMEDSAVRLTPALMAKVGFKAP
ncbi:MAG TPA: DNA ligase D [Casimicrobiaceae bacterium]|nr:DNA ligase D [Casimicrobiaceae bacterium]